MPRTEDVHDAARFRPRVARRSRSCHTGASRSARASTSATSILTTMRHGRGPEGARWRSMAVPLWRRRLALVGAISRQGRRWRHQMAGSGRTVQGGDPEIGRASALTTPMPVRAALSRAYGKGGGEVCHGRPGPKAPGRQVAAADLIGIPWQIRGPQGPRRRQA